LHESISRSIFPTHWVQQGNVFDHHPDDTSEFVPRLFHVKARPVAQIAQDIKDKVCDLICHVDRVRPFLVARFLLTEQIQPTISIAVQKWLSTAQSSIRESIIQDTSLACMSID
jgi:hypothetical protein